MRYYEVFIADSRYHGNAPLTYSSEQELDRLAVVTVTLRQRAVTGFITKEVEKPEFELKPIKALLSKQPLPSHCLVLAEWLENYYVCTSSEALRQFAPSKPTIRRADDEQSLAESGPLQLELDAPLTDEQKKAINFINKSSHATTLFHGDTGTGKTRVYLELARQTLDAGSSAILLTPEIALTAQLAAAVEQKLRCPTYVLHSQLTDSQRKKIWLAILESQEPVVVIGPRSALFCPVKKLGLVVVDEAHEPAYKQDQTPRYNALRVASQLGVITKSKVVFGSATPAINDYYLAKQYGAVVRMTKPAIQNVHGKVETMVIDAKDRNNFSRNPYISNQLLDAVSSTVSAGKQAMLYLNRRGSARVILCTNSGWQLLCPNCDIPLVYHGDEHIARCHICGHSETPPMSCPECGSPDIIYRSIGTKALMESAAKLFPQYRLQRFDSDNVTGERVHEVYESLHSGEVDILVGTQLLAKGFDLPKLGLVGVISAETSLSLPDYTAEERTFQLLYQVMGRVGRGHGKGSVIVQAYDPENSILKAAIARDWESFYKKVLAERQQFRFPPFSYLMQLTCRRLTSAGAEKAAFNLRTELLTQKLPVEIIGPTPSFYARRGRYFYWQLVIKSKQREHLVRLAKAVPSGWIINLDPIDLI